MRKFDVAYNPPLPDGGEKKKTFEEMTLDELVKEIGKSCAKCHGDYTICEGCMGCLEGRILIDKLKDAPKDKFSGIRNMKNLSPVQKQEIAKNLYHDALMADDPIKFLMEECGISKKNAIQRFSAYKKKYGYVRHRAEVEKAFGTKLEPKKMVEIVPDKHGTVDELVRKLTKEREDLVKRISQIDSALRVIKSAVG